MAEDTQVAERDNETEIDAPGNPAGEVTEQQNADKEHNKRVQTALRENLKPAFGNEDKNAAFTRKMVQEVFKREMGNIDIGDKTANAVFAESAHRIAENAEADGESIKKRYIAAVTALDLGADTGVTLKGNVNAMDMVKAYANFRPSAKLQNQTFFNAV